MRVNHGPYSSCTRANPWNYSPPKQRWHWHFPHPDRKTQIYCFNSWDFCIVWFQTVFLTRRDINCRQTKVSLRSGIAFAVVVVVTVAVVNTFIEHFRNGLCSWGFLDVFNACNKLSPETHIKIIGCSPEEKDHPTPQWKAEGIILVMYF